MNAQPLLSSTPLILIADDDPGMRKLLRVAMEEEGYRAIAVINGQQCLDEYKRFGPDMVLLDALMPEMDGFTCCEDLRRLGDRAHIPILMITALDDRDSIARAFAVGATDYITKPIHWSVLSQRVKRLLHTAQAFKQLDRLTQQFAHQQQWDSLISQLLSQWHQPLQSFIEPILAQIKKLVAAQRVLLYQDDGKLWAEVLQLGYPSVGTLSWQEVSFSDRYWESYQQGQIVVVDLGFSSDLPPEEINFLNQLTKLSQALPQIGGVPMTVKTATLVPLLLKQRFWGLLCLHHCHTSYQWQSWELSRLSHLANLLAIALNSNQ